MGTLHRTGQLVDISPACMQCSLVSPELHQGSRRCRGRAKTETGCVYSGTSEARGSPACSEHILFAPTAGFTGERNVAGIFALLHRVKPRPKSSP